MPENMDPTKSYMGEGQLELPSGGLVGPSQYRRGPPLSVLGTPLHLQASWHRQRLRSASVDFSGGARSTRVPVSRWVTYTSNRPAHAAPMAQQLLTEEEHGPCAPRSLRTQTRPGRLCVPFPKKKVLRGKRVAEAEEVKQTTAEALKGITTSSKPVPSRDKRTPQAHCITRRVPEGD